MTQRPVASVSKLTFPPPGGTLSGMAATTLLDLIGLKCPWPALKTRHALGRIAAGDRLEVHCSDPLAAIDIPNMVRETGDRLEQARQDSGRLVFLIEKAGAAAPGDPPCRRG